MQHLQKTRGEGAVIVNQESDEDCWPERPSGVKDLSSHFDSERPAGIRPLFIPDEGICPEEHRDDRPVPTLSGRFQPCWTGSLSPVPFQRIPSLSHLTRTPARISPRCWRSSSFASSSPGSCAPPSASASVLSSSAQPFNLPIFKPSNASLFCIPSGQASPSSPPSSSSTTSSDLSMSLLSFSYADSPSSASSGITPFVSRTHLWDEPRSFASPASQHSSVPTIFLGPLALRHFDFQLSAFNFQPFFSCPLLPPSSRFAAPLLANTTTPGCTARKPFAGSSPTRWSPASAI